MKKPTQKQLREQQQKAQLKQRLSDLAHGSCGGYSFTDADSEEFVGMAADLGLAGFGRWVGAIQKLFGDDNNNLAEPWMLENYDSLTRAVEYLWDRGVRP